MKGVAVIELGRVAPVFDVPTPIYGEYEVLVRVRACGLCNSTDLKIADGHVPGLSAKLPYILGHEAAGEVVALGDKVKYFAVGDHVLNPYTPRKDGDKYTPVYGNMQEYSLITDLRAMVKDGKSDADYTRSGSKKIPAGISFEDAGMILSLKENYSALTNFGFKSGMDVLLYGDGPVCMGLALFARLRGASTVAVIGHHDDRLLRVAKVAGADIAINAHDDEVTEKLAGRTFDLVIDAVGKTSIIKQGAAMLKPGGKVCVYGVLSADDNMFDLISGLPNHASLHMLNWPYREHDCHDEICTMIVSGKVNPGDFYSHVMPMEECVKGVELIRKRQAYKVIFTF